MMNELPEKGTKQYYEYKAEQRKKRVTVRLLLDHYTKASVAALHAENNSDTEREAEALAEALTTVIRFLDPSGAISVFVQESDA